MNILDLFDNIKKKEVSPKLYYFLLEWEGYRSIKAKIGYDFSEVLSEAKDELMDRAKKNGRNEINRSVINCPLMGEFDVKTLLKDFVDKTE